MMDMHPMANIMITGAHGLIGHALRVALEGAGQFVIATDLVAGTDSKHPVETVDVLDRDGLLRVVAENEVEAIVHCGGASGPMVRPDDPSHVWTVNTMGTANVLEAARLEGVGKVVYCSSTSAFGRTPDGLDRVPEDVPLRPTTVYAASKAAGEHIAEAYAEQFGMQVTSLRFSWVYGPRRRTECLIRDTLLEVLAGRPARIRYGRTFYRQYVHVDDVVRALRATLEAGALPRRSYTITGDSYLTIEEVAQAIREVYPDADIEVGDGTDPQDEVQARFDISASTRDLDYRPRISLQQGIHAYGAWLAQGMHRDAEAGGDMP